MKRVVLLANHSIRNAGDHAILIESIRLVEQAWPGASITLVFNDHMPARRAYPQRQVLPSAVAQAIAVGPDGSYQLGPLIGRIALTLDLIGRALLARLGIVSQRADQRSALVRAIAEADIAIGCGGGYMRSDPDQIFGWFTLMVLPFVLAILIGRPLVILPQSVGPLMSVRQRSLAFWIIRRTRLLVLRERISLGYLESHGLMGAAIVGPDIAFGMPGAAAMSAQALCELGGVTQRRPGPLIGITAINWAGQSYTFESQASYEQALLGAVDQLTARGATVLFFSQCTGPTRAEDDRVVAEQIRSAARMPEQIGIVPELSPQDLQGAYGALDLLIGTRMHSVILATNAGTPALAIGYQPKSLGVLTEMGLQDRVLDIAALSADQLSARALAMLSESPSPQLARYIAQAHRFKQMLAEQLRIISP